MPPSPPQHRTVRVVLTVRRVALVIPALFFAATTGAATPPRLLHAEVVTIETPARAQASRAGASRESLHLGAFGRHFELALEPSAGFPRDEQQRHDSGTVNGAADSWARISRSGAQLTGLIYSAGEYYAIEPAAEIAAWLPRGYNAPADSLLIYRLADLLIDADSLACGLAPGADGRVRASDALLALSNELGRETGAKAPGIATAIVNPPRRITLAPMADEEFAARYANTATNEILTRLNTVDGIFNGQVGIDIAPGTPVILRASAPGYPFSATDHTDLLDQLSDYRLVNHQDFGLTHLFSHKDFANNVAGVAWLESACRAREGAALSSSFGLSTQIAALVAAHELGHNFGAPHDGETGSACAATPATFLMAATGTDSSRFSDCSVDEMSSAIGQISALFPACLTPLSDFDVDVTMPGVLEFDPGATTQFQVVVVNTGTETATNVRLEVSGPSSLTLVSASAATGFCDDPTPQLLSCDRVTLLRGGSWAITVVVGGSSVGEYSLSAQVWADIDRTPQNNTVQSVVQVGDPPPSGGGGGGGGGSLGLLTLLWLPLLHRRRLPSAPAPSPRFH